MHKWLAIGVDESNGKTRCRGCEQKIEKGELRFWYLGGEYGSKWNVFYWHPKCFLQQKFFDPQVEYVTGKDVITKIISVFLPLLVGEEEAKPILVALNLKGGGDG
jgi:hypothetical protein